MSITDDRVREFVIGRLRWERAGEEFRGKYARYVKIVRNQIKTPLVKSIDLCKNNDFFEQLYRGYISIAMLYEKLNQFNESLKNMDVAIETASKKSKLNLNIV